MKRNTQNFGIAWAIAALAFAVFGGAQVNAQAVTPLTVSLHFNVPQLSWYGLYWSQEKGYFRQEGLDVTFQYLKGSTLAVQATGAGQSNIGIASADSVLAGVQQNLPIIAVANHIQNDAIGLIVRDDGKVGSLSDLADKTVASAQTAAPAAILRAVLERAKLSGRVKVLSVDPQAVCTLLIAGNVDGCTGFSFAQLLQVEEKGVKAKFFPFSTPEKPVPGAVIFANETYLKANDAVVRKFLRAAARGYTEASADVPATIALMQKIMKTDPPQQIAKATPIIVALTDSDRVRQNGWGWMTDAVWSNIYTDLVDGKVLKPGLDVSKVYTNGFLPGRS
jgi:NitT/TauT family transport system substrate-binding protein